MKKKILVIFLFAIIISLSIYKCSFKKIEKILVVGEEKLSLKNNNIDYFLYDNITYKELINSIKLNDYITIKNNKKYLNQLINSSSTIYITANKSTCIKRNNLNDIEISNLQKLINIIKKISFADVIIINYCNNTINIENATIIYKNNKSNVK